MTVTNQTSTAAFVARLRQRAVTLTMDGASLRVAAPKGTISQTDAAEIGARKSEILALLALETVGEAPIALADRSQPLPLGYVQQRMWVHNQLESDTVLYNLPAAWELSGPLDDAALGRALSAFLARHEVMRIVLSTSDGIPQQTFAAPRATGLEVEDLTHLAAAGQERHLQTRLAALRDAPIELERGEPFRARLFRLAAERHVFFFMPHHVVWDGWSFDIFLRELGELYAAQTGSRAPALTELPLQYADYAQWHRDWLASGALETELTFWAAQLKGEIAPLDLPADKPRPRLFSHRGDWEEFTLSSSTMRRIGEIANQHRATSFMVLMAAWQAFLARISGQSDIIVGIPIQARQRSDVGNLVGCFVNTLCIRQQIDPGMAFTSLLEDVRTASLEAFEHQDVPFEHLVERLGLRRDPSRTPLFQAMFSHQQVSRRVTAFGGVTLAQVHVNPAATPTDLMLAIMEGSGESRGVLHYSTDIFTAPTIHQLRLRFEHFLAAILEQPASRLGDLAIITPQERELVLHTWNQTARDFPLDAFGHTAFMQRAAESPAAIALVCGAKSLTYRELDDQSSQLAAHLAALGAGPGQIAGIHLERSIDMVVAILAVWKCGAATLPLDPSFPGERIAYMLEDSRAGFAISTAKLANRRPKTAARIVELDTQAGVIAVQPTVAMPALAAPDALAYVLYTSGSTGKPKGVEIAHRSLVNFLTSMAREPGLQASDRLLAVTTISFDISILELMLPLSVGARAVIAGSDETLDGYALSDLIDEHAITVMQATPATWRLLIEAEWTGSVNFKALCGGEALPPALADQLLERTGELWNMYGPTETTIWSACGQVASADHITIGRPIANTGIYILDDQGQPLPPGLAGELWISGEGVARGYLGNPQLTAERFADDPFSPAPGVRMYRTGDWARFDESGAIEFQRRRDNQVKVRGFRIELGEIETALAAHASVAQAVVVVRPDAMGEAKIVAYTVLRPGMAATSSEQRTWLRRTLPDYMLPHYFVDMAGLPLTGNNKVDRNALPAPSGAGDEPRIVIEPRTAIEHTIAEVWRTLLGVKRIAVGDNFFELGGDSLQAAQMAARVMKQSGHKIAPRAVIFETLEQLARAR